MMRSNHGDDLLPFKAFPNPSVWWGPGSAITPLGTCPPCNLTCNDNDGDDDDDGDNDAVDDKDVGDDDDDDVDDDNGDDNAIYDEDGEDDDAGDDDGERPTQQSPPCNLTPDKFTVSDAFHNTCRKR